MNIKPKISLLAAGMVLAALANAVGQATFTKIIDGDIVNDLGQFVHPCWGDFNNDCFLDLFVSNYIWDGHQAANNGTNVLYLNNRNGTFTKITHGDPVQDADFHVGSAMGDYDNDGNLDLLVTSGVFAPTSRRNVLYHGNGDGTFSRASDVTVTNQLGYFGTCAWADYGNDGFLDLFITDNGTSNDDGGTNSLFHNNGDGSFAKTASGSVTSDIGVGWASLWADYDNDGFMDLLVVNNLDNAVNFLYHNERNGTFTRVLTNDVATDVWPQGAVGGAWGDYDNDGSLDLFITTSSTDQNRLYHNNGDGTFTETTSGPLLSRPLGASSAGCAWGDYDNDGFLDLFVVSSFGNSQLFHNNGNGTFTEILSGAPVNDGDPNTACNPVSWVDYDNDGFLDLFVGSSGTDTALGKNRLYHNDGNSNTWLEVKCVGTVSNRSAIGAKVRVRATIAGKTFWQLREINEGGTFNSVPLVAHFGLGQATNVEVLRIEWPSGTVREFQTVAAKQILTVFEPSRLSASVTAGVPHFSLRGGRGFQYQIEASTNLTAWLPIGALSITNLDGTAKIIDANPPASDRRFYRAVLLH